MNATPRSRPLVPVFAAIGLLLAVLAILGQSTAVGVVAAALGGVGLVLALGRRHPLHGRGANGGAADLTEVLDAVTLGVIVLDARQRTLHINEAACGLFQVRPDEAIGKAPPYGTGLLVDDRGRSVDHSRLPGALAVRGQEVRDLVLGIERGDERRVWCSTSSRIIGDAHAGAAGLPYVVLTISDITEQHQADIANEAEAVQLRHRALHDSLTGLPNRTLLMDRLAHARRNAGRRGAGTGLVVIDLDGFKAVNDNLGHAAGDEVLVQVAVRLRTTLRASDTAARLGGDEFVVLCEDLHPAMAELELAKIAERIQTLLDEPYITSAGPADVGASVGWSVGRDGEELDLEVVMQADERMLADKRERKARSVDADEAPRAGLVADSSGEAATGLSVYIVDDDAAMRLLASRILETSGTGLRVVGEAEDGTTAIEQIVARRPDLVLCDVMMPTVSGPEVVEAVRAQIGDQRFIFWSATGAPELMRYEEELGVPFVLKDRIEQLPAALLDAWELSGDLADGPA